MEFTKAWAAFFLAALAWPLVPERARRAVGHWLLGSMVGLMVVVTALIAAGCVAVLFGVELR